MGKDNSVVKSFRTTEEQFSRANEIFLREGFNFSEVIRLLLDATIREDRIPRGLSTREMEDQMDAARHRDDYINSIINTAVPGFCDSPDSGKTAEERLLDTIFGRKDHASEMSNAELRDWGSKWGLPDTLSTATLADLYDSGFLGTDPWSGDYDYDMECEPGCQENMAALVKLRDNLEDNLSQLVRKMRISAVKTLMEYDNSQNDVCTFENNRNGGF